MVNSTDFTNRLKKILDFHQLTASLFADKIGVQRSSISHILSGRNKPSLDFIIKVTTAFTDVNMYWLIYGEGSFPSSEKKAPSPTLFPKEQPQQVNQIKQISQKNQSKKEIERIVVFYTDSTFDEYHKENPEL